jgi:hypothetical protein
MQPLTLSACGGPWTTTMSFAPTSAPFVDERRDTDEPVDDFAGAARPDREGD